MKKAFMISVLILVTGTLFSQNYSKKHIDKLVTKLSEEIIDTMYIQDKNDPFSSKKTIVFWVKSKITGNVFSSKEKFTDNKTYSIFQKILKKGKIIDFLKMTESKNPGIRVYGFWALLKKGKNGLANSVLTKELSKSDKVYWNFSGCLVDEILTSTGMNKLIELENKNGS